MCTAMFCPQTPVNFRCNALRTQDFQRGDVTGHWRLTDQSGRACELILDGNVTLTASCVPLEAPVTRLTKTELVGSVLQFFGPSNETLLAFDTSNPDDLKGIGPWQGYRLVRLEPGTLYPFSWEGTWELQAENGSLCDIFLSMRSHRLEDKLLMNDVRTPLGVAFQSGCVSRTDASMFRFSRARQQNAAVEGRRRTIFVVEEPLNLPLWTGWRHEVFDLVFHDADGHETVFKRQEDNSWRTEIAGGDKPSVLRLRRKLR
jgi:hypothetical protein